MSTQTNANAEAQQLWRDNQKSRGLRRLQVMCVDEDVKSIREYAHKLNAKRGIETRKKSKQSKKK